MAYYLSREEAQVIMAQYQQKESISAISAATGRDRKTIAKVVADQTDENAPARRSRPSKLDPYTEYIAERWAGVRMPRCSGTRCGPAGLPAA